jgi:hypothetical protein
VGRLIEASTPNDIELTGRSRSRNTYAERVLKYIPAEIVAGYVVALTNIIKSADPADSLRLPLSWGVFTLCLLCTPLYLRALSKTSSTPRTHLTISTIAFALWAHALGGPFELAGIYKPWIGSLLLVAFTVSIGAVVPRR